jgi:hypothetical protein
LYERLEDKRIAVDMERRHQNRRHADAWNGDPHGPQDRQHISPENLQSRSPAEALAEE